MQSNRALNAQKWQSLVDQYIKSGDTLSYYSKKIGVNKYTLAYWVKKFSKNKELPKKDKGFVQLQGLVNQTSNRIFVRFKTGVELDLPADYDLSKLLELVRC